MHLGVQQTFTKRHCFVHVIVAAVSIRYKVPLKLLLLVDLKDGIRIFSFFSYNQFNNDVSESTFS